MSSARSQATRSMHKKPVNLCASNEQVETEIKNRMSFTITEEILRCKSNKTKLVCGKLQSADERNQRSQQMERHTMFMNERLSIVKIPVLHKLNYNAIRLGKIIPTQWDLVSRPQEDFLPVKQGYSKIYTEKLKNYDG